VGLSSSSRFTLWLILEVNTLLLIGIIYLRPGGKKTSALVKYFTIQSLSSILFIYANASILVISNYSLVIRIISLLLKLGIVPLHLWYLSLLQDLSWIRIFILSTVQKLLPLFFIRRLITHYEIFIISLLSRFTGVWALGASSIKRLIGYSSLLNIGWILLSTLANPVFFQFFLTYFFTIFGLINYFRYFIREKIRDFKKLGSFSDVVVVCLLILRLRAFPPLLGFWAKLYVLKLIIESSILFTTLLLLNTVFIIYTYIALVDFLFIARLDYSISAKKINISNMGVVVFCLTLFGIVFLV